MHWTNDRLHFAGQYSPLGGWYLRYFFAAGMAAGKTIAQRQASMHMRRINTFIYVSFDHVNDSDSPSEERNQPVTPESVEQRDEKIRQYGKQWDNEWLPEVKGYHAIWNGFDLESATPSNLIDHFDWSMKTVHRMYVIHGQLLGPGTAAAQLLEEMYTDLFEDAGRLDVFQLTQGFENSSTLMGWDLYDLSLKVAASPELSSLIKSVSASEALGRLGQFEEGVRFVGELNDFLDVWGNRAESTLEIGDPTWSEDPSPVIQNIKTYLSSDSEHPRDRWKKLVENREVQVNRVRNHISTYPEPVKRQFEELLGAAQRSNQIIEDHNWWIDQQTPANVRHVLMEFGRRLASSGAISKPNDVFMLEGNEIIDAAKSDFMVDLKPKVKQRTEEMERWSDFDPPIKMGAEEDEQPDPQSTRPASDFFGAVTPEDLVQQTGVMTGSPASSGKIIGTARVITRLGDAGRLAPGEILVTVSTLPPWTPLFATAGGVVTDAGGTLSHAAIVAREYGLPAVVGTVIGTKTIKDGQQIEVNGDEGTVRLLD